MRKNSMGKWRDFLEKKYEDFSKKSMEKWRDFSKKSGGDVRARGSESGCCVDADGCDACVEEFLCVDVCVD